MTRLCLIALLAYCSYAICRTPLLPLLARDLGASPQMVGLVMGASTLTGVLVKLPAGACSDVLGRRPLLLLGTIVFAVMPFTYLGVASLGALVALRFVHGSASAIFGPVASAALSDLAPVSRRATWLGVYSAVQGTGQAVGAVIAGYFIAAGRFDLAFLTAGLVAAATPFMAARWPASPPAPARTARTIEFGRAVLEVCRHPLILITSLAQAAQFVLHGALSAFLPLFAQDALGLSASTIGWLFALQMGTTLAARPLMGMVADRVGRRGVIAAGLSLCGCGVLLMPAATGAGTLAAGIVGYALGVAVTTAATTAFITDLARRARYGAAHGVFGTIYDVGDALGPIGAGLLVASLGYTRMFTIAAALAFVAAAAFYAATRRLTVEPAAGHRRRSSRRTSLSDQS